MTEQKHKTSGVSRYLPTRGRGVIGVLVVVVLAFVLGAALFGRGDGGRSDTAALGPNETTSQVRSEVELWTCSMHPQIKLPQAGKCPICFMDLIPLDSGLGDDVGLRQLQLSETAKQLAQIQTTPARRAFAEAEVRMAGKIAYDETKLAYITAWVPGRLDRLFADFTGIIVKPGDHLVEMYSPEMVAAQEELIQAHTAVTALNNSTSTVLRSTARETLDATRDKLRLWGLTVSQIERIETTGVTTDHLTIYAPIGGVVVHKDAKEGMYVQTGTRIYTIADLSKLWVIFEAYESDLPWLRFGQKAKFTSPSFPGWTFDGVISFIDPVVDPKTRTVQVRAVVDNPQQRLKPDMFVRGVVHSRIDGDGNIVDEYLANKWISPMHPEIVRDAPGQCDVCGMDLVPASSLGYVTSGGRGDEAPILIPATAPLITGRRAVAYVEIPNDDGPLFEGREIELGPRAGDFYVVTSGIAEGELVVSNGAFKIDSELQIRAKPSMMSPQGGAPPPTHDHGGDEARAEAPVKAMEVNSGAIEALTPVYDSYFRIQMALAKDDLPSATNSASKLAEVVAGVDMSVFSRSEHDRWMELSKDMALASKRVAEASDFGGARDAFYTLSKATIELHAAFGNPVGQTFYLANCPMARGGDGADWLQNVNVVWNSYYGDAMLRCGSATPIPMPSPEGNE